jgi:sec-independent protein translocase protein TatA
MFNNFGFLDLGAPELIIILAIVLLLFGGKKLPELSKSLGESMRELRKGVSGEVSDDKNKNETTTTEVKSDPKNEA